MAALNNLTLEFPDREGTLCALADVAEVIRRTIGEPVETCPYIHPAARAVAWGPGRQCCVCGLPVLPAPTWHKLLVSLLRLSNWTTEPVEVAA